MKHPVHTESTDENNQQILPTVYRLTSYISNTVKNVNEETPGIKVTTVSRTEIKTEFDYIPDLTTTKGIREFFRLVAAGQFFEIDEASYIKHIFREADSNTINYRQLFLSLKKILDLDDVDYKVKWELRDRIALKIDFENIDMSFVELLYHLNETGLIDNPNVELRLRKYLKAPSLIGGDIDDDYRAEASKRVKEISRQLTDFAELSTKRGNVLVLFGHSRVGYMQMFSILDSANVFFHQPRLLDEIVDNWKPRLFTEGNSGNGLVEAFVGLPKKYRSLIPNYISSAQLLARKVIVGSTPDDAFLILKSGLADEFPEEYKNLKDRVYDGSNTEHVEFVEQLTEPHPFLVPELRLILSPRYSLDSPQS